MYDGRAVDREMNIELNAIGTELESTVKGGKGVFRELSGRPAMTDSLDARS